MMSRRGTLTNERTMKTLKDATTESQAAMILEHLKSGKPLTAAEAWKRFGCARLGARVFDLRARGHEIEATKEKVPGRRRPALVAVYRMAR